MITYLYWLGWIALGAAVLWFGGMRLGKWQATLIALGAILVVSLSAYFFHYQQVFVKRWGGVMSVSVPDGWRHIAVTWKDDNLWVENYNPATNVCEFREYSRGDVLQGRVVIKNCNPLRQP